MLFNTTGKRNKTDQTVSSRCLFTHILTRLKLLSKYDHDGDVTDLYKQFFISFLPKHLHLSDIQTYPFGPIYI